MPELAQNAAECPQTEGRSSATIPLLRIITLTILFSVSAVYEAIQVSAILAPAVWVHLRTGVWILQNHAFPRTGLFSQYSNSPWNDAGWSFELILGLAYRALGLRAIPFLLMILKVALALVTFLLARAARANFWTAIALSAAAQYVIAGLQPLPYAFSVILFAMELILLVHSRESGSSRGLRWLPLLFFIWANVDIQFVFGLVLLALYLVALGIEQLIRRAGRSWISDCVRQVDVKRAAIMGLFSLVATFATPYTIHLLPTAFSTLYNHASFEYFGEMSAMSFRHPQEFVLMLMVMVAFLSLGRLRSLDSFSLLALIAATAIAFRVQREGWLVALVAVAIIPAGLMPGRAANSLGYKRQGTAVACLTAIAVIIAAFFLPHQAALMGKLDQLYPVKACDYIRDNHLPQPLFNAYSWGSFLTWYLPEYPVAIDNRVELYGDQSLESYFGVVGGKQALETDGRVSPTGTLLLERQSAMTKALLNLPVLKARYRLVYSDDLASVFVGQPAKE